MPASMVQGVMWRFVLTVSLLCWRSEGTEDDEPVTCRDKNNGIVDWYIIYKAPNQKSNPRRGLKYLYIDSEERTTQYASIKDQSGVLANTLQPLFTPIRSMPENFGFISYSDQPPGSNAHERFGHSKGVLMVEKERTGVWLLHSTPQFPFRRDLNHFWPKSGEKNAQMFICVTFQYNTFKNIGHHLQAIGAFPFEHDIPENFHKELKDAVKWVQRTPPNKFEELKSHGGDTFFSIAKKQFEQRKDSRTEQSEAAADGDLYIAIAKEVKSDLHVQTWGCQKNRSSSCESSGRKVLNIENITTVLGDWDFKHDHSKWCVATDQNQKWTCIADVNRAPTQYKRRGGALCIKNEKIQQMFQGFVQSFKDCPAHDLMDVPDTDCDGPLTDNNMDWE